MNAVVQEWVQKAEGDFATALRELSVNENPNYDAVCFHAQQCIEKLLKALIIHQRGCPPKTHDLAQLSRFCKNISLPVQDLHFLSHAAIAFRYPGEKADIEEASNSVETCKGIRKELLDQLHKKDSG